MAEVLNALRRKLAAYEAAGMDDLAKRQKAAIAELEKAEAPKAPVAKKAAAKKTTKKSAKKR